MLINSNKNTSDVKFYVNYHRLKTFLTFLPRCMECRRGLAMRIFCLSVRPSVRLSVKRVDCDKTQEKYVQIYTPYERSFSL